MNNSLVIGLKLLHLFVEHSNHKTMGLIKEPKNVDFTGQSKPWSESELCDFRKIMNEIKAKNSKTKIGILSKKKKVIV